MGLCTCSNRTYPFSNHKYLTWVVAAVSHFFDTHLALSHQKHYFYLQPVRRLHLFHSNDNLATGFHACVMRYLSMDKHTYGEAVRPPTSWVGWTEKNIFHWFSTTYSASLFTPSSNSRFGTGLQNSVWERTSQGPLLAPTRAVTNIYQYSINKPKY